MTFFLRQRIILAAARLARCVRSDFGGIAVTFAMSLPVLVGATGLAVDFLTLTKVKGDLQAAADAAAMAGAREIQVAKSAPNQIINAAIAHAKFQLTGDPNPPAKAGTVDPLTVSAQVVDKMSAVQVDISEAWTPFFAHFLKADITPVTVTATARFVGSNNVCVLGLSSTGSAVFLDKNARLTGNNCGVFSNSTASDGLRVDSGAMLTTSINCAAGGSKIDSSSTVSPNALTSCPAIPDPLASRPNPSVGGCDHNNLSYISGSYTLGPGTYCGGITISGTAAVTFNPGVYVLLDGDFEVSSLATASGGGTAFFFTGSSHGKLNFTAKSHIAFSAPESGPMAGILFGEDRTATNAVKHKITSDDARKLIGTIYFPAGDLVVDAKNPVADQSAWTAIIVRHLELNSGPNLVLNSDYSATNIPVPEGIKGTSQVILTE